MAEKEQQNLIKKAQMGDEDSFEALILSCKGKAYNIAFRYLKNEEDAMDALQESFIKIYRSLSRFQGESKFDTWVYRIVVNTCNDMLRKNSNRREEPLEYQSEEDGKFFDHIVSDEATPEQQLLRKEDQTYLLNCLQKLNDEHREILILRDMQGFSYEETAKILQCSVGTVKSRISRARNKLKEIYLENMEQKKEKLRLKKKSGD